MNPYKTIWLQPKRTFVEFVLKREDQSLYAIPIVLLGVVMGLDMANDIRVLFGDGYLFLPFLISIIVGIAVAFLIFAWICPGLVKLLGRIWQGKATMRQLVNVYSVSLIPYALLLINQMVLLSFGVDPSVDQVNGGVHFIIHAWTFGLLIVGVSKVQQFSYGFALLNIFMAYLPMLILGLLVGNQ